MVGIDQFEKRARGLGIFCDKVAQPRGQRLHLIWQDRRQTGWGDRIGGAERVGDKIKNTWHVEIVKIEAGYIRPDFPFDCEHDDGLQAPSLILIWSCLRYRSYSASAGVIKLSC